MLTVTVLTGQRPGLLTRTLDSFTEHHRALWDDAYKVVLHNSGDRPTADVLDRFHWDVRHVVDTLLPVGEATSRLVGLSPDVGLTLRLEDDWLAHPGSWFEPAAAALDGGADQVRLRRRDEPVSSRCAVCRSSGHLHFTFNPTLTRASLWYRLAPMCSERDAMRKFHGLKAVQHDGVFSHIGGWSLRRNRGAG